MSDRPRPTEPDKRGPSSAPAGDPQPSGVEVESARLLANRTKDDLMPLGIEEDDVRRLAGEFIALHLGEAPEDFIAWAQERVRTEA